MQFIQVKNHFNFFHWLSAHQYHLRALSHHIISTWKLHFDQPHVLFLTFGNAESRMEKWLELFLIDWPPMCLCLSFRAVPISIWQIFVNLFLQFDSSADLAWIICTNLFVWSPFVFIWVFTWGFMRLKFAIQNCKGRLFCILQCIVNKHIGIIYAAFWDPAKTV